MEMRRKMLKPEKLGVVVARRRIALKMTQGQLGEMMGVDQSYISKVERGKETPSVDSLMRMADALQIGHNPGLLLDALAGVLDEGDALIKSSVLQVPLDFTDAEWNELEDALNFILWKRNKGGALVPGLSNLDAITTESVLGQVQQAQKYLADLEKRISGLANPDNQQATNDSTLPHQPPGNPGLN